MGEFAVSLMLTSKIKKVDTFQTRSIQLRLRVLRPVAAVLMSGEPIFVPFLQKYAGDGNNLNMRHHCLILL